MKSRSEAVDASSGRCLKGCPFWTPLVKKKPSFFRNVRGSASPFLGPYLAVLMQVLLCVGWETKKPATKLPRARLLVRKFSLDPR